ncbi:hypothetical protein [Picosynechococcus sp. PCC 7002]|nr:hypothetical protein [Picosynechococcus sp. PCC 7002]
MSTKETEAANSAFAEEAKPKERAAAPAATAAIFAKFIFVSPIIKILNV